ncbi:unnamed protein product [Urochloa humidicola]
MCLRGGKGGTVHHVIRTSLPDGLKNLTSLEVLESVVVTSECIAKELGYLTRLRVLEVEVRIGDDDELSACTNALVKSLGKLKEIESLRIRYTRCLPFYLDGSMERPLGNLHRLRICTASAVPTWIEPASLPGLSYLDITVFHERRADIQTLGKLPCLRHLTLRVFCHTKKKPVERCVVGPDAFPCLLSCEIHVAGRVAPSMFPRGAMPKLEDLTFSIGQEQLFSGVEFTIDDLALDHLPSLRSVAVHGLYGYDDDDDARKDKVESMREKLEHEAAVHPNRPLRIQYRDYSTKWSFRCHVDDDTYDGRADGC